MEQFVWRMLAMDSRLPWSRSESVSSFPCFIPRPQSTGVYSPYSAWYQNSIPFFTWVFPLRNKSRWRETRTCCEGKWRIDRQIMALWEHHGKKKKKEHGCMQYNFLGRFPFVLPPSPSKELHSGYVSTCFDDIHGCKTCIRCSWKKQTDKQSLHCRNVTLLKK